MMAAGWSVLFIAWPYLVDQVPRPQRLLVERSWYGLRFALPALAGVLCPPFVARYPRRPVALAVAAACLACASLASGIELQRVDDQRGDMLMAEALKQSDKYVWYGALFAAVMSLGAGLTVRPRPQAPRRSRSTLHGDASWMPMKQVARLLPETGSIVIGERYRVDRDDVASVDFGPKNPFTWGRGGRARLVTYDPTAFPAGSTHGLVFAGSGGFKTVSTVVSTCLRWTGGVARFPQSCHQPPFRVRSGRRSGCPCRDRTARRGQPVLRALVRAAPHRRSRPYRLLPGVRQQAHAQGPARIHGAAGGVVSQAARSHPQGLDQQVRAGRARAVHQPDRRNLLRRLQGGDQRNRLAQIRPVCGPGLRQQLQSPGSPDRADGRVPLD